MLYSHIESLTDEEVSQSLIAYLTDLMRKWKEDPTFNLPELKQIIVTRWLTNQFTLGSYGYRETDSDVAGITNSDLAKPLMVFNVPRVLFAGEAAHDEFYSAVHGAFATGAEQAMTIVEFK